MSFNDVGLRRSKRRRRDEAMAPPSTVEKKSSSKLDLASELQSIKKQTQAIINENAQLKQRITTLEGKNSVMARDVQSLTSLLAIAAENQTGIIDLSRSIIDRSRNHKESHEKIFQYHEQKLRNQRWTYSAEPIPTSHWTSLWNNEYAESAQDMERQMKDLTHNLMLGWESYDDEGVVSLEALEIESDIANFIHHDDIVSQHWKELAYAICQYEYALLCLGDDVNTCLSIANIQLRSPVIQSLGKSLSVAHFKTIEFKNNDFDRDGIKFALEAMKCNARLEGFVLSTNRIECNEDLEKLCDIIRSHPTLKMLDLTNCFGGEVIGFHALCSVMTAGREKLQALVFRNNLSWENEGRSNFLDLLSSNPFLEDLTLGDNSINDGEIHLIANSLKSNRRLKKLYFVSSSISRECFEDTFQSLLNDVSNSLNAASDSNSTLREVYWGNENENDIECVAQSYNLENGNLEPNLLRKKKIYCVLSARNGSVSNTELLKEFPLKLLPSALKSIENYHDDLLKHDTHFGTLDEVPALSVVYEILRGWDKAFPLYEALGHGQNRNAQNGGAKIKTNIQ